MGAALPFPLHFHRDRLAYSPDPCILPCLTSRSTRARWVYRKLLLGWRRREGGVLWRKGKSGSDRRRRTRFGCCGWRSDLHLDRLSIVGAREEYSDGGDRRCGFSRFSPGSGNTGTRRGLDNCDIRGHAIRTQAEYGFATISAMLNLPKSSTPALRLRDLPRRSRHWVRAIRHRKEWGLQPP